MKTATVWKILAIGMMLSLGFSSLASAAFESGRQMGLSATVVVSDVEKGCDDHGMGH